VEEFGLGFPPRAYTWKGKDGMIWSLNWIPLGGFVRVKGEGGDHREDKDSFGNKPLLARFAVLFAGVFMNMIAAAVLLSIAFGVGVPTIVEGDLGGSAIVSDTELLITQVLGESPAALSGIEAGDRVMTINGETFEDGEAARTYLQGVDPNEVVNFLLVREGESLETEVAPSYLEEIDGMGVGVAIVQTGTLRYPWYVTPVKGVESTFFYTKEILVAFGDIVQGWVGGGESEQIELAGPIGIAVITGEVVEQGIVSLLQFAAILSINLAIINVFPFPALDGGRILFVIIEAVRRKPVDAKIETVVHNIGFLILIGLILLVTYQDILNLL
jgi:regulator of sigma E protease